MTAITKSFTAAVDCRQKADRSVTTELIKYMDIKEWPPGEASLIDGTELKEKSEVVEKCSEAWYFPEEIPEEHKLVNQEGDFSYIKLDYAIKKGYPVVRIQSPALNIGLDDMENQEELLTSACREIGATLRVELESAQEDPNQGSPLYITAPAVVMTLHNESFMQITLTALCALVPTTDFITSSRMRDLNNRMGMLLQQASDSFPEGMKREWQFSPDDAEMALALMQAANPSTEALTSPATLLELFVMGIGVASVTAEDTRVNAVIPEPVDFAEIAGDLPKE